MSETQKGVVGLDLSLEKTGMCFVPPDWNGSRESLRTYFFRTKRSEKTLGSARVAAALEMERQLKIADKVIQFVKSMMTYGDIDVAVENYAYSMHSASTTRLAELGGVIKSQVLLACKIPAVPISSGSARKFLTGGLKRGEKQKTQVEKFLRERNIRFDTNDEMDAFAVAYYWYGIVNKIHCRWDKQPDFDF